MDPAVDLFLSVMPEEPPPDGCWLWRGNTNGDGYGWFTTGRKPAKVLWLAHRVSYLHFIGSVPAGFEVTHSCDTPPCVQPVHLVADTHAGNMRQGLERGRVTMPDTRGMVNGMGRLTDDDVRAIRASTEPLAAIAARYGVSYNHVSDIRRRVRWPHI
jgi:hypothetical protein